MSQIVEIVSEPSATKNLGESSDTQALHAHFCPNFQPIYHLALDGLQPDVGHEVLWVIREVLSGEIVLARALLNSSQEELAALLTEAKEVLSVPVSGIISDGQQAIRKAVVSVFPAVPHQLCHFHYLREAVVLQKFLSSSKMIV